MNSVWSAQGTSHQPVVAYHRLTFRFRRHGHCPKRPTRNVECAEFVLPPGNCTWKMVLYTVMYQGVNCALDLISHLYQTPFIQRRSAPVLVDAMDAVSTALEAATPTRQLPSVPASIVSVVSHPCCNNGDILKRIPKGARSAAANLLSKLIREYTTSVVHSQLV